jgi:hypothetical protein
LNASRHIAGLSRPARQRTLAGIALAIAALLLVGEIMARVAGFGDPPLVVLDDKIEYYLVPAREYQRFGKLYRINSRSMRSDEIAGNTRLPASTYAILGDSVVYGKGLDQSATIAQQLRKLLAGPPQSAGANPGGPLVLSIAASSWGPENLLAFYDRFGPIPGNTAWIVQSTHDMIDVINQPGDPVPYRMSPPYGALHDALLAGARWAAPHVPVSKLEMVSHEDKRARADAALATLITRLRADYRHVVLVFHATRDEALLGRPGGEPHFRSFATRAGVDFISTRETYQNAVISGTTLHSDDIHPNEHGAVVLAQLLYSSLTSADAKPTP